MNTLPACVAYMGCFRARDGDHLICANTNTIHSAWVTGQHDVSRLYTLMINRVPRLGHGALRVACLGGSTKNRDNIAAFQAKTPDLCGIRLCTMYEHYCIGETKAGVR